MNDHTFTTALLIYAALALMIGGIGVINNGHKEEPFGWFIATVLLFAWVLFAIPAVVYAVYRCFQ